MGLFDKKDKKKKGGDDFDSPIEQIDLSAPTPEPEPVAAPAPRAADEPREIEAAPPPRQARKVARAREPEDDFEAPSYGINKAIELMRTLPTDNIALVVTVIKHTLESTKIQISEIIADATHKQDDIEGRIKVLKGEIEEFEAEIATRRDEIGLLEADFAETSQVKEHLLLAENLDKKPEPAASASSGGADRAKAAGTIGAVARGGISGSHQVGAPGASKIQPTLSGSTSKTTVVAKK